METYKIRITEVLVRDIEIEAPSYNAAVESIKTAYNKSDIVLDSNDFAYYTIY
jgi:hypothetical protein